MEAVLVTLQMTVFVVVFLLKYFVADISVPLRIFLAYLLVLSDVALERRAPYRPHSTKHACESKPRTASTAQRAVRCVDRILYW